MFKLNYIRQGKFEVHVDGFVATTHTQEKDALESLTSETINNPESIVKMIPNFIIVADVTMPDCAVTPPIVTPPIVTPPIEDDAINYFKLEIDDNDVVSDSSGNGGSINFYADHSNGVGDGINGTNISVIDILDDPDFPSGIKGLRDTYRAGGTAYTFGNQTAFIKHAPLRKFFMRLKLKLSPNWQWGDDQLKFCKNKGDANPRVSTNCPKFDGNGNLFITKLVPTDQNSNEFNMRAVPSEVDDYNGDDGFNNGFGDNGEDANWTPELGVWHDIVYEIDAGTGVADGSFLVVTNGREYMKKNNTQVSQIGDALFSKHELGHVWQNGSPTEDIYMDWHSIEIFDKNPMSEQVAEPTSPMPSSPVVIDDSFESNDLLTTNADGFTWEFGSWTSLVTADTEVWVNGSANNDKANARTFPGGDWTPHSGTVSMRFRYKAGQDMSEQRFTLGKNLNDFWASYFIRVPTNYAQEHGNNKFLSLWVNSYDNQGTVTWQTRPDGNGGSNLLYQDGGVQDSENDPKPFISQSDQGRWMQVIARVKAASSSSANDGVIQFYRRWDDETEFTLLHEKLNANTWESGSTNQGIGFGYLMGWANSPFSVDTEFLLDEFKIIGS